MEIYVTIFPCYKSFNASVLLQSSDTYCNFWLRGSSTIFIGKVISSILVPNLVIAKDVKSCRYLLLLCQMYDINSLSRGERRGSKQAQLSTFTKVRLPDKDRAIKVLFVNTELDL